MFRFAEPLEMPPLRLGAILAGGRSRRFGSPKQTASVGGVTMVERVAESLRRAGARPVLITAPHVPDLSHLLPCRNDLRPGHGPLSGLHTALVWSRELGSHGALCIACDLPFASSHLLRSMAEAGERRATSIVVPDSPDGQAVEPLCAWYPTSLLPEIVARMDRNEHSLRDLVYASVHHRLRVEEVRKFGEPASIFLNVNTPADRERAAAIESHLADGDDV